MNLRRAALLPDVPSPLAHSVVPPLPPSQDAPSNALPPAAAAPSPGRDDALADAQALDNLRRIRWLGLVVPPINALHLWLFSTADRAEAQAAVLRWQAGVQQAHAAMALCFGLIGLVAWWLARHPQAPAAWRQAWPVLTLACAAGFAVWVVSLDQLVTPNVMPFVLFCALAGVLVVLHPLVLLALFGGAFAAYWAAIGLTQTDAAVLLSNRVNGLTGAVMGTLLGSLTWRQTMENRRLTHALHAAATTDSLTGLANRLHTVQLAEQALARGRAGGQPATLLLLDLDHFKQVNDRLGHPVGDQVLQRLAAVIRASLRSGDIAGRLGGEEFVVLLPHTDVNAAQAIGERLRARLAEACTDLGGVTCSIGLATTEAGRPVQLDELYARADQALYRAKQAGRNQVAVA